MSGDLDPLLKYSNILDGLFHDAVVLCEGDADCRYYSAVLDYLPNEGGEATSSFREAELLFTHCGGKARMASVVSALKAVSVPVVVVADFDLLREASDVGRLVGSMGGDFSLHEADLKIVASALTADTKPLRKTTLQDALLRALDGLPNEFISASEAESVRRIIRSDTGWDKAKRAGLSAVPQGDAYAACERLLKGLQDINLLVVPVGELERFEPRIAGHGPAWVSALIHRW